MFLLQGKVVFFMFSAAQQLQFQVSHERSRKQIHYLRKLFHNRSTHIHNKRQMFTYIANQPSAQIIQSIRQVLKFYAIQQILQISSLKKLFVVAQDIIISKLHRVRTKSEFFEGGAQ